MEQELPILPEHPSSSSVFSGVRVTRFLVFYMYFCRSLFVLFILVIMLSVPLRFTASDYPFGNFNFSYKRNIFFPAIPLDGSHLESLVVTQKR